MAVIELSTAVPPVVPPHFHEELDCSICWMRPPSCPAPLVKLPCGHLMCAACLRQYEDNHCSLRCQNGGFDKFEAMRRLGISIPVAVAVPISPARARRPSCRPSCRAWREDDDIIGEEVSITGARPRRGLSTSQVCGNASCRLSGIQRQADWGEGDFDLIASPDKFLCSGCSEEQFLKQVTFTDCYIHIQGCEVFSNGKKKKFDIEDSAHDGMKIFKLDGDYACLEVSTIRTLETSVSKDDHVSVDADWIEKFGRYYAEVDDIRLNAITDRLRLVVPNEELSRLRGARITYQNSWGKKRNGQRTLRPTPEREDDAILLHYYTLEDPSIYYYVSDVLNSPETRLARPDKVKAVMPFVKGVMEACRKFPEFSYGPAEAYRGMQYVFDDDRWAKFKTGNPICWYTVKSVAATKKAVQKFLGDRGECTVFRILNCTGTMIKAFSAYDYEDELLVMPGALFEVKDAQRSSNRHAADVFERADIITLQMTSDHEWD